MKTPLLIAAAAAAALGLCTAPAFASSMDYTFSKVTNNTTASGLDFVVEISDDSLTNQIRFTISNNHAAGADITEAYWDTDAGASGSKLFASWDTAPADWKTTPPGKTAPPDMPGSEDLDPDFDADFAADSGGVSGGTAGTPITYGNSGIFILDLKTDVDYGDLIAALNNGDLRIGIHVRSIGGGDSDSFVTTPVPEPASLALMALGLSGLAVLRRRRKTHIVRDDT